MKKVYVTIYLMIDSFGNKASAICEESCDTVQASGLRNKAEDRVYFESEAYHLDSWCRDNGIKLKVVCAELDFDVLWVDVASDGTWKNFELKEKI